MKRVIRFSRHRFVMLGLSGAIILTGIVLLAVRGLNMGIDFRGGLTQQIQVAPVALALSASGDAKVEASSYSGERQLLGGEAIGFTVTKGAESQSYRFTYSDFATLRDLAAACETVPGVAAKVVADASIASSRLFPVDLPVEISRQPLALNYALEPGAKPFATIQTVRAALKELGQYEVQTLGRAEEQQFILKFGVPGGDDMDSRHALEERVKGLLGAAFKADEVIVRKTDYVGPSLAGELATQTVSVVAVALVLMLLYLSLRFRFESALACVLCVVHDSAVMVTVVLVLRLEFSTSVIAAILTIIGYSVNDTIVIFDRVRENNSLMRDVDEKVIFDTSLSQTLGRTIITSFVTLLAVVAMYVFTSGSLKDFALMLIVGIAVGSYSTIYIASPIVMAWHSVGKRRQRRSDAAKYGLPAGRTEPAERRRAEPAQTSESGGQAGEETEGEGAAQAAAVGGEAARIPSVATGRGTVVRQQQSRRKKRKR